MEKIVGLLMLLFAFFLCPAQDVSLLLQDAAKQEAKPNEMQAYQKYKEVLAIQPNHIFSLSKCSELCSRIGKRQTNNTVRDSYYENAKKYADQALKINPNDAEANCVMAIALGRSSLTKNGKEKIQTAKDIKIYVERSIQNDPRNYKAWHVLGRWHYEISNLNFIERAAVKIMYGGLPSASIKESITAFEIANTITKGFILNYFEMAKAYKKNDDKKKAIACLNSLLVLPNQTEDDPAIKADARKLLDEWD